MTFSNGASFASGRRVTATIVEHTGEAQVMDQDFFFATVRTSDGEEIEVTFDAPPPEAGSTISARLGMPVFDNEFAGPREFEMKKLHEIGSTNAMPTFLDVREAEPDEELNQGGQSARGAWKATTTLPVVANLIVDEEDLRADSAERDRRLLEESIFYRAMRAEQMRRGQEEMTRMTKDIKLQKFLAKEAKEQTKANVMNGAVVGMVADLFLTGGTATLVSALGGGALSWATSTKSKEKHNNAIERRDSNEQRMTAIESEMFAIRATTSPQDAAYEASNPSYAA